MRSKTEIVTPPWFNAKGNLLQTDVGVTPLAGTPIVVMGIMTDRDLEIDKTTRDGTLAQQDGVMDVVPLVEAHDEAQYNSFARHSRKG